jgi:hypothetical protein
MLRRRGIALLRFAARRAGRFAADRFAARFGVLAMIVGSQRLCGPF